MMIYPKTLNLFKRDPENGIVDYNNMSCEEFANIKRWHVEEKMDGTNIRLMLKRDGTYDLRGRGENANLPQGLVHFVQTHFTRERIVNYFSIRNETIQQIVLFGEGYGPKIQKGGLYRNDISICLFDVHIEGWWLTRDNVVAIAKELDIPYPHQYGMMTIEQIVSLVRSKPLSPSSVKEQVIEGVIARSEPLMMFRNGDRIMFKAKVRDIK